MKTIGMIVAAAALVGAGWYVHDVIDRPVQAKAKERRAAVAERVKNGPYIASSKDLSEHQQLQMVVVPSSIAEPLDVKCLVYRDREFKQVAFTCPDANQADLELPRD